MNGGENAEPDPLVEAAIRGDRDAWGQLFRRLYPRLRSYAARRAPQSDVDDIVNETMSQAVASIHRYRPGPAGFDAWVFGIARRVSADHLRRMRRFQRTDGFKPDRAENPPGEAIERDEEHVRIREALARLSTADRELLELRTIDGFSADQIASILGKRPGAVRTAQSRALARLRRILEADE